MKYQGGLFGIGAVLHGHFSLNRRSHVMLCQNSALQQFETRLMEWLEALKLSGEVQGFLSVNWLPQAMSVVLATHTNLGRLIPDSELSLCQGTDKWIEEYLDDNAKLLDVCNVLRDGIADVENYQTLVQLALHNVDNRTESCSEGKYYRARNTLADCKEAIKKKDTEYKQGVPKSKLENCSSLLRTMGEKLINPRGPEAIKGNGLLNAIYGAKLTTIFLCNLVVTALACKPRRPLASLHLANHYKWSGSLVSLQQKVKEEIDKSKNMGSIALLRELHDTDVSVRRLHEVLDWHLTERNFPMRRSDVAELKIEVEVLRKRSSDLGLGLAPLEIHVNELFRMLIATRLVFIDVISRSKSHDPSSLRYDSLL